MRIFFQLLYHRLAWTYDLVAAIVSVGLWKSWVLSLLPYLEAYRQGRILELGYGPGHLQKALRGRGLETFGLDASPQMARLAFRRLRSVSLYPMVVNGYAQFMPFQTASFCQVAATFPTEYLLDPATLQEIYRILSPGGRLVILPAAWITGKALPYRLAAALFRITGQIPHWDVSIAEKHVFPPLVGAGFQPSIQLVSLENSQLLFVFAGKPQPN